MLVDKVLDKFNLEVGHVAAWVFTDRGNFAGIRIKGQDEVICRVSMTQSVGEEVLLERVGEVLLDQVLFSNKTDGHTVKTWADLMNKYFFN
jgi:hypothetical protein